MGGRINFPLPLGAAGRELRGGFWQGSPRRKDEGEMDKAFNLDHGYRGANGAAIAAWYRDIGAICTREGRDPNLLQPGGFAALLEMRKMGFTPGEAFDVFEEVESVE